MPLEGTDIPAYHFFKKLSSLSFIEEIWLFGSRARGDHQSRSDIDLAIVCPTATQDQWREVLNIIDQADTLLKIDVIRLDTLSSSYDIKDQILRDRKLLYRKK